MWQVCDAREPLVCPLHALASSIKRGFLGFNARIVSPCAHAVSLLASPSTATFMGMGHCTDAPEDNLPGLTGKTALNEQKALGVARVERHLPEEFDNPVNLSAGLLQALPRRTTDPAPRAAPNRVWTGGTTHLPKQGGGGL